MSESSNTAERTLTTKKAAPARVQRRAPDPPSLSAHLPRAGHGVPLLFPVPSILDLSVLFAILAVNASGLEASTPTQRLQVVRATRTLFRPCDARACVQSGFIVSLLLSISGHCTMLYYH